MLVNFASCILYHVSSIVALSSSHTYRLNLNISKVLRSTGTYRAKESKCRVESTIAIFIGTPSSVAFFSHAAVARLAPSRDNVSLDVDTDILAMTLQDCKVLARACVVCEVSAEVARFIISQPFD